MSYRVGLFTALCYGLPALALALLGITYFVFIPKFYTDVVGIDLVWLGAIIVISRLFDAGSDPLIGMASDRTKLAAGRRRPWILGAVFPLAVFFYLLLVPSSWSSYISLEWGFALFSIGFFFFWTCIAVPYEALGAELFHEYDQRTRLLAIRDALLVVGTLAAAVLPELLTFLWNTAREIPLQPTTQFQILALLYTFILATSCLLLYFSVSEDEQYRKLAPSKVTLAGLLNIFKNAPFRILIIGYVIGGFGAALPATLMPFYVEYVLGSSNWGIFLVIYFCTGLMFLPLWVVVARWWDKKWAWISSMIVNCGAFAGVLALGPGDLFWFGVLVAVSGIGYGASLAIPSSMQADVVDFDEHRTGERREGQLMGAWSVAKKCAAALGAGAAFPVLGAVGYVQGAPMQSPNVQLWIAILYAGVPTLCNIGAIIIAFRYPITRISHQELRSRSAQNAF